MPVSPRNPDHLGMSVLLGLTAICTATAFVLGHRAGVDAVQVYLLYISRIFLLGPVLLVAGASLAIMIMVVGGDQHPLSTFAIWRLSGWYLRISGCEKAVTAPAHPRLTLIVDK